MATTSMQSNNNNHQNDDALIVGVCGIILMIVYFLYCG